MHTLTYQNPVWKGYFADPFVIRIGQYYYAYGTGAADRQGRPFPMLQSKDLVHWEEKGGALIPLADPPALAYWAPELAVKDNLFYLYYSASTTESDDNQRMRVALAEQPLGPFKDSGHLLLPQAGFTIDGSPFQDPRDGKRYLYYAADYELNEPHGTGLRVVELNDDMLSVRGEPRDVLRASAPWQVYEKNRQYKGRLWAVWNCVEGPNVLFHDQKYYCFYSGGAWRGDSYGVECAVADHPLGPWNNERALTGPGVLRAVPGKVIGPGHNSIVTGPDDRTQFMVYHAWNSDHSLRQMCIDPIQWTPSGPRVDGPSTEVRTIPAA